MTVEAHIQTHIETINKSWPEFIKALTEINNGIKNEWFDYILDEYGASCELYLIFVNRELNNGSDPTQMLYDFVKTHLDGIRYAMEGMNCTLGVCDYLLEKGAIFPQDLILQPFFDENYENQTNYEDIWTDFEIRSVFIEIYGSRGLLPDLNKIDWSEIDLDNTEDVTIEYDQETKTLEFDSPYCVEEIYEDLEGTQIEKTRACIKYITPYLKNL